MLRQKSGSQSSKYAQHRSHGKKVNYKIKFPRHSNDRFARFARSGVELGLNFIKRRFLRKLRTRNIYTIFLQNLCKLFGVQGSDLWITWTEPAGPVLQGPVQGSAVCLNRTRSPVQGSGKVSFELDQTGPRHHYLINLFQQFKSFSV